LRQTLRRRNAREAPAFAERGRGAREKRLSQNHAMTKGAAVWALNGRDQK
jgi:hypothetical protein